MKKLLAAALLAACATEPKTVDFVVPGTPTLFEGKVADRPWETFTGTYDGMNTRYSLVLDGDFELLLVSRCPVMYANASELFGTSDEVEALLGSWQTSPCPPDVGDPAMVTGTMIETSELALDATGTHHNAAGFGNPFDFSLQTHVGLHDLVLWNESELQIVHDVALADGTDLGAVSLDAGASSIPVAEVNVPVDPDEDVTTSVELVTRNGTSIHWSQAPQHVFLIPTEQLGVGDRETFQFEALSDHSARFAIETGFVGLPGDFELLPRINSVTGSAGTLSATWTPFADYFTSATAVASDGVKGVTMSRLWLRAHPGPIAFDDAAPGFHATNAVAGLDTFLVTRRELAATVMSATTKIIH